MSDILINCVVHPDAIAYLESAGYRPHVVREEEPERSHELAPRCVGMVANASLPIDGAFFERAPHLRVVGRVGVGYDNVDVAAATRRGVRVCNTPLPVVQPVAEHTFALLLAVTREIVSGDRAVRDGLFRTGAPAPQIELAGSTLGLVGLGNTGRRVAEVARRGFGMNILYFDLIERPEVEEELGARRVSLEGLLEESDVVSLHVNLNESTRHLIDARALGRMKPDAILLNIARGPIVDEEALVEALKTGQIRAAGLDVFEEEPPPANHPLLALPNVVLNPHRGGFSARSMEGCSRVVEDIVRVLRDEEPKFSVN